MLLFIPMNAKRLILFDPTTNCIAEVGDDLGSAKYKYGSASLGADGAVYCAPMNAPWALRVVVVESTRLRRGIGFVIKDDAESASPDISPAISASMPEAITQFCNGIATVHKFLFSGTVLSWDGRTVIGIPLQVSSRFFIQELALIYFC